MNEIVQFQIETLHLVCKTMNSGLVSSKQSIQFSNEMHFYADILPAIQQFEQSKNIPENERIDAFVRYFGSRLSLNSSMIYFDKSLVFITFQLNCFKQNS